MSGLITRLASQPPEAGEADERSHEKPPGHRDNDTSPGTVVDVNRRNVTTNSTLDVSYPTATTPNSSRLDSSPNASPSSYPGSQVQFRAHTIAPSPIESPSPSGNSSAAKSPSRTHFSHRSALFDPDSPTSPTSSSRHPPSPLSGGSSLRLQTDLTTSRSARSNSLSTHPSLNLQRKTSASSLAPLSRTPSLKTAAIANAFGFASAASSTVPSPVISAMGDITPLPSPLLTSDSPGPWRKLARPLSREGAPQLPPIISDSVLVSTTGETIASALENQSKRKAYSGLGGFMDKESGKNGDTPTEKGPGRIHARERSVSDYVPDPLQIPKRMTTVSGSHVKPGIGEEAAYEPHMRREPHLSEARGLTPIEKPPTPPPSESSMSAADPLVAGSGSSTSSKRSRHEYFEAYGRRDGKKRRWRAIKMLGQGTFSRVMLATSQTSPAGSDDEDDAGANGMLTPEPRPRYERRTLVAVKVCEHGPKGGASEHRIEMSLKRELEIMQSIHHPSLVHLRAWNIEPTRAILVLSHCPGGDLFDVASNHRDLLTPTLLRRMFSELVSALSYLHERRIVHRDVKLENVLVNLVPSELAAETDWLAYPYPVVTLTDLGLSRRIADDEKLETRCGSDDYAAPEVIMGQPYDGRATDAWSLGVLLYALLESRLPFDPHPNVGDLAMQMRMRSRTSHRIARVEWRWIEYGVGDDEEGEGDHDADLAKFEAKGLLGAMEITEGLLKRARSRWPLSKVAEAEWVKGGIQVEGGIKFHDVDEGEEVL